MDRWIDTYIIDIRVLWGHLGPINIDQMLMFLGGRCMFSFAILKALQSQLDVRISQVMEVVSWRVSDGICDHQNYGLESQSHNN